MKIIEGIPEMVSASAMLRRDRKRIALVPTMGCLHEGHLSLVEEAKKEADTVVVSIFVNPTQFGEGEDFDSYPREIDRDRTRLEAYGTDLLFLPAAKEMYSQDFQTAVEVTGLSRGLCGDSRPGHFRGVATVVAKLFNIVTPHVALFGEKDFQQLAVIKQMVKDLNYAVEIVGMPTRREADGLAMSSRNLRLLPEERARALSLHQALRKGETLTLGGEKKAATLIDEMKKEIAPGVMLDYLEIRDPHTLEKLDRVDNEALFAVAARVGRTRLIDNIIIGRKSLEKNHAEIKDTQSDTDRRRSQL